MALAPGLVEGDGAPCEKRGCARVVYHVPVAAILVVAGEDVRLGCEEMFWEKNFIAWLQQVL